MSNQHNKNKRLALKLVAFVVVMIGLAFASVPLYRIFCAKTGFAGIPGQSAVNDTVIRPDKIMTVRFNADVNIDMPWSFKPEIAKMDVALGQDGLVSFIATNPTDTPITGTAIYNVTPERAAKYFHKTQCFCFDRQVLKPGQTMHFPVTFFVDPAILNDPEIADLQQVTLSYTFFRADSPALQSAIDKL